MASNEVVVKIDASDLIAELNKAQETLSEDRIRQIVQEEIEKWQQGVSLVYCNYEVK